MTKSQVLWLVISMLGAATVGNTIALFILSAEIHQ